MLGLARDIIFGPFVLVTLRVAEKSHFEHLARGVVSGDLGASEPTGGTTTESRVYSSTFYGRCVDRRESRRDGRAV